jgi:3-oxoacyl-[acyl-carrier-protein] synthase III
LNAAIHAVEYHLPAEPLSNAALARQFPDWAAEKIEAKTGIVNRRLAAPDECASDLAVRAACKLFERPACRPDDVDFLLLCTQSPDYLLPTTACIVQHRLGIPTSAGALDINLGCSGYVYGLSLAKGLIETGQARNVLLLTCETYSKFMDRGDFNVRALFGDGASATLIQAEPADAGDGRGCIGPFVFGTDGRGAENLIVRRGGTRHMAADQANAADSGIDNARDPSALFMNGPEIFTFTLKAVPDCIEKLLAKAGIDIGEVDLFVFHQANSFMLEHLRKKLQIPVAKFVYAMEDCGNTTSSTIPIALCREASNGRLRHGSLLMLVGFGVGYSWAAALLRWCGANAAESKLSL